MRTTAAAVLAMAMAAGPAFAAHPDDSEDFGVAAGDGKTACVATLRSIARFPLAVTLRTAKPSYDVAELRGRIVAARAKACKAMVGVEIGSGERPVKFYTLRLDPDSRQEDGTWNAVVDFAGAGAARLRACNSVEGLHFTAWSGRPLHSKRIWHGYVYLGYDSEANCDDSDRDY